MYEVYVTMSGHCLQAVDWIRGLQATAVDYGILPTVVRKRSFLYIVQGE